MKERLEENSSEQLRLKIAVEYDYKHIKVVSTGRLRRTTPSVTMLTTFTSSAVISYGIITTAV